MQYDTACIKSYFSFSSFINVTITEPCNKILLNLAMDALKKHLIQVLIMNTQNLYFHREVTNIPGFPSYPGPCISFSHIHTYLILVVIFRKAFQRRNEFEG